MEAHISCWTSVQARRNLTGIQEVRLRTATDHSQIPPVEMFPEERRLTLKSLITHHRTKGVLVLLVLLVLRLSAQVQSTSQNDTDIVQAIEDEIYDYSLQADYDDIGTATGKNIRHVNLYIFPNSNQPGSFNVIYKLPPPYGEIYRMTRMTDDGLAFLYTRPEHGFRSSGPAFSTVYVDDDKVCKLKADATRTYFEIQVEPEKDRLEQAIARQKRRYGYSTLEKTRIGRHPKQKE